MNIKLSGGFNRGARLYKFDGVKIALATSANDCTWKGDLPDDRELELPEEFVGFIAYWRIDGLATRLWSLKGINLDLGKPTPEEGWFTERHSFCSSEEREAVTLGDWAIAQINGSFQTEEEFMTEGSWSLLKDGSLAKELAFEAGSQEAAAFVVISPLGEITREYGAGEDTPYIGGDGITSERTEKLAREWLYERHHNKIREYLKHPKDVPGVLKKFQHLSSVVVDVATEMWPITFGNKRPSLAP